MNRKKLRPPSASQRIALRLLDEYEKATGDESGDMTKAAIWLYNSKKIDAPEFDPIRAIARILAAACRNDYIADENGEPVRHRHAYVVPNQDKKQTTFSWFKIENATPEKMRLSVQGRRNGTLQDIMQLVRDVNFYNRNYNPGEPIEVDANFTHDIAELSLPTEYPEEPPAENQDDS